MEPQYQELWQQGQPCPCPHPVAAPLPRKSHTNSPCWVFERKPCQQNRNNQLSLADAFGPSQICHPSPSPPLFLGRDQHHSPNICDNKGWTWSMHSVLAVIYFIHPSRASALSQKMLTGDNAKSVQLSPRLPSVLFPQQPLKKLYLQ